jgi:hypothetical protein
MREMEGIDDALVDFAVGVRVEILNPFVPSWSPGFVIDGVVTDGYRVRRELDDHVLPRVFAANQIRPASPTRTSWW